MAQNASNLESFVQSVADFIDRHALLPAGAGVVAGVSGGADSVAMVLAMSELSRSPGRGWRLTAAHLNHLLRADAQGDADFVTELCAALGLPVISERRDAAAEAARTGQSVEQAARMVRYEFLADAARRVGATHVAVAHHADDNVETILYRVARGTHLRGLAGIPVRRRLGKDGPVLVRPMLGVTRDRVESFLRARGAAWRTDTTNLDVARRRNFIRLRLLPLLREQLNPRVDEAILRLGAAAGVVEELLAGQAGEVVEMATVLSDSRRVVLRAPALAGVPSAIRAYAIRQCLESLGAPMRQVGADELAELAALVESEGPQAMTLPGGLQVRREGDELVIETRAAGVAPVDAVAGARPVFLPCPGEVELPDGRRIVCAVEAFDAVAFERHCRKHRSGVELLDADKVRPPFLCRPRRPATPLCRSARRGARASATS